MKRLLVLLSLIVICYNVDVEDCTGFEAQVIADCLKLGSDSDICIYSDNKCISSYKECTDYNPSSGFDDKTCTLINPTNGLKKCVVIQDGENKTCQERDKQCADHNDKDTCIGLQAGDDKRCVLLTNGKCEAHYDLCTKANQDSCNSNIPKDTSKKCNWDTSCIETDRLCEDLISYNDNHISSGDYSLIGCLDLKAETDKVCINLPEEGCKQYYASCDKANGKEDLCGTFKPVNNAKNGFKSDYYCSYSDSTCTETKKKCENFVKGEDDASTCANLQASNTNKMCYYNSEKNECPEIYITCDSYNLVKEEAQRDPTECAAITYRDPSTKVENPHYECYLKDAKTCTERKKACDAIKDSETCNSHELDDEDKKCLFTGSKCKEIYKTCKKYKENVTENKKKEDCEIIPPFYESESGKTYKCVFGQDSVCKEEELKCEDYKGQDALECQTYSANLDDDLQCALIGGKCIEQFNACEKYKETNKTICESIILYAGPYNKCILYHDKECKTEQKLCSEYLGDSETECNKYKASVDTKECVLENHKCVEKSILNYCSDYRGTNKEECESIKPFFTERDLVDPSSKCVYTNEGCIKKAKGCGEATAESECLVIIPEDTNKQCVYIGNSCTEQYKTCQLYNDDENVNTIDMTICESILIQDTDYPSTQYRCEYGAPATGQTKGTCTRKKRSCSDFEPKLIQSQCGSISLTDKTKKCVFDNNSCSPLYKTCSELSNLSGATDDLCKNGVTSSADKSCVAKSDKSGCEEKEKEKDEKPEETTAENPESQPNEAEPTDGNSFSSKNYLSILTFIAVCLVF